MHPPDQDLADEQETIIQMIAWKLYDTKARAEFPGPVKLDDARRSDIIDLARGFRVMTGPEERKVKDLVLQWRSIEDEREKRPWPRTMHLRLEIDGAKDQELQRGLQAAAAVFEGADINPEIAAYCCAARDAQDDIYGFDLDAPGCPPALSRDENRAADTWIAAHEAAVSACCAGWAKVPFGAGLSLIRNPPAVPLRGAYIEYEIQGP